MRLQICGLYHVEFFGQRNLSCFPVFKQFFCASSSLDVYVFFQTMLEYFSSTSWDGREFISSNAQEISQRL